MPSWLGFHDRRNWRTIAVQYETSDSTTYLSGNNDWCPNVCNSREECKIPKQTRKLVEIFIKDEKGTALSNPEGLNEGIQELKEKTGLLVADSLTSVSQGKSCLNVLNMRYEAINIYHDSNTAPYTNLTHQIQVNGLFRARNDRSIRSPLNLATRYSGQRTIGI